MADSRTMKDYSEGTEKETEEEKSMDLREDENPPSEVGVNTGISSEIEVSDKRKVRSSGEDDDDEEENPSKRQKHRPGLRDSSERINQEEQSRAAGEDIEYPYDPDFMLYANDNDDEDEEEDNDDIFLFEMAVPVDNILTIPAAIAKEYFPTLACTGGEQKLQIQDFVGREWDLPVTYNQATDSFTNTSQWQEISNVYRLSASCLILFYKPAFRMHSAQYTIEFERRVDYENRVHEFRIEGFLFKIELAESDLWMGRLFLPFLPVHKHFPAIRIPVRSQKVVTMKFTDAQRKNWYMEIVRYTEERYMIIKWWDEFVKNHSLQAEDVIRFYKSEYPSHSMHFLIEVVKKDGPNQLGGGNGADRGEASTSGSYKGKEIAYG